MAFEKLQSARLPRQRNKKPAVHLYTRESRRVPDQVETRLRITRPLMTELEWAENQRLDVMVGTEEDEGSVKVSPNPAGPFVLRPSSRSKTSFVISSRVIPMPPGLNKKVEYTTEEGELTIRFA